MFSTDFESLLVRSAWDVFLKLSFSLLACFRWGKITMLLLQREQQTAVGAAWKKGPCSTAKSSRSCKAVVPLGGSVKPKIDPSKTRRLRTIVGIFRCLGVGCVVYTAIAVHLSQSSCSSYPQCVQFSFLWTPGSSNSGCKCLAYVDRDLAPADSDNLTDVTQTLAELAAAGSLKPCSS